MAKLTDLKNRFGGVPPQTPSTGVALKRAPFKPHRRPVKRMPHGKERQNHFRVALAKGCPKFAVATR